MVRVTALKRAARPFLWPASLACACLVFVWVYRRTKGEHQQELPRPAGAAAVVLPAVPPAHEPPPRSAERVDSVTLRSKTLVLVLQRQPHDKGGRGGLGYGSIRNLGPPGGSPPALLLGGNLFEIEFADGAVVTSAEFEQLEVRSPQGRQAVEIVLLSQALSVEARFKAEVDPALGFVRVALTLTAMSAPIAAPRDPAGSRAIKAVRMLRVQHDRARGAGAKTTGNVQGLPVVFQTPRVFFGVEHPMSVAQVGAGVNVRMPLYGAVVGAAPVEITAAFGAYGEGQLRRDFHEYIEAIRAVPWRQWL